MLTPRESKGLEFDHVVVVEPALIVEEGGDSGLRELYVALTRPTKTLIVVHARPLPALGVSAYARTFVDMSILWIILIVVLVLALLGFFGRGRAW